MFITGKYVVAFSISWNLKSVNIGFINYQTDLDKYFDVFADCMSPKTVAGFHELREKIKKGQSELNKIELSDNDLQLSAIAYNLKKYLKFTQKRVKSGAGMHDLFFVLKNRPKAVDKSVLTGMNLV